MAKSEALMKMQPRPTLPFPPPPQPQPATSVFSNMLSNLNNSPDPQRVNSLTSEFLNSAAFVGRFLCDSEGWDREAMR